MDFDPFGWQSVFNTYLRAIGWSIAGLITKDKAIMTNFGLQVPLFLVGIYKVII